MNIQRVIENTQTICDRLGLKNDDHVAQIAAAVIVEQGFQLLSDIGPSTKELGYAVRALQRSPYA